MGVILSIPDPAVREQLSYLYLDPYSESILARLESGSFGPSQCAIDETSASSSAPPDENIYASDDKEGVNPFVVGANNRWQQYVLAKYYSPNKPPETHASTGHMGTQYHHHQGLQTIPEPGGSGQQRHLNTMLSHQYGMNNSSTGNM